MIDAAAPDPPRRDPDAHHLLGVEHLQDNLVAHSVRSGGITIAAQGVKVAVQAIAIAVLARLLAPADFGLFAMVAAFLSLLELLKDFGLSTATVQSRDLTLPQVSTLFWLNVALGVSAAAAFALAAPLLAWGYGEEELRTLTPVVALAFVFTGLAAQHLALLRRQMRFIDVACILVAADVVSLAAAVAAAVGGLGVWSLVVQRLIWSIAIAVGGWVCCRWVPGPPASLNDVRGFISFGGHATASMLVNHLASSLDKVLIGWYWGAAALGFYDRAQRLQMLPIQNLTVPIGNVAIAALSRLADQPDAYRRMYRASVERLAMLITPVGGLLVGAAAPIVELVLGTQWAESELVLSWFGAALIYLPVTHPLGWLYLTQGRTNEMLGAAAANSAVTVAAVAVGLLWGPIGVAACFTTSGALIRLPLLLWLVGRRGPVRVRDLWRTLLMPAAAGAAVAFASWGVRTSGALDVLALATQVVILCSLCALVALGIYIAFPAGRRALRSVRAQAVLLVKSRKEAPAGSR